MSETFDNTWPKSTRLNQHNRQKFVDTVVADLMPDDNKPDEEAFSHKWGQKVYDTIYGPHLETMKLLPSWMFKKDDDFTVDLFANENKNDPIVSKHNGNVNFKLDTEQLMIREQGRYSWNSESLAELPAGEHEVVEAYKELCQQEEDWRDRFHELRQTLTQVAEACNTSHQLFRAWPKAVKYAQECFPYVEPAEAKRGGQTDISADQLDLTAKLAQTVVRVAEQN